ncbi:GDP-mannose 4,6-dehydratase [Cellulomonas xiejunii]|uniref:GDP-mannose 4,6-dehydratase n=1 Tax=Cellulomonas xiejunii TaxID=2968083 RepID=A0ABY5KKP4_9CELL|nr:GDP-mannose 4,6-dehydratase [Cellulomonas xiejunii]MCC2312924.1 GDP-mannose 4,6-dehydratase [Cellulomonas xiejunii]MCC2320206.1 GDP-mannose 4,6-dehydratase [Cellulomonas xiejunii]UUI70513.1 GDP-mannose 4,6-dehydratase [Cellulomonas xiejunii]
MTRAFITGISGQDGTILAGVLAGQGVEVHGLVRSADEAASHAPALPGGVTLHVGELTDGERISELLAEVRPDEVYNLAGISSVAYSWEHPVQTGLVSGLGAVNVFEAARRLQDGTGRPVRVLQASSAEIFGNPDRTPQDESTRVAPLSPYGAAKAYAHQMAAVFRSRDLHVATVVLYNHESPLRPVTFVTRKITAAAARIAHEGAGTLVLGDLSVRRDWGWAPDYVDAMVRTIRHGRPDDFVIATGRTHSVEEFVAAAMERAGVTDWRDRVSVDPSFVRPAEAAEQVGDASKALAELGWSPTVPFSEIVGRMVDHDLELLRRNG